MKEQTRFGLSTKQDGAYFYMLILIVSIGFGLTIGTVRAFSIFLPIWEDEFEASLFGVSSIYYFFFGGSMLNVLLAPLVFSSCAVFFSSGVVCFVQEAATYFLHLLS